MNKTMLRLLLLAMVAVMLIGGSFRSALIGADQFRDPLSGKSLATKRSNALAQPTLLSVSLAPDKGSTTQHGEVFVLSIGLKLPEDGYTYSTNPDFPGPTRIILDKSLAGVELVETAFVADHEPETEFQPSSTRTLRSSNRVSFGRAAFDCFPERSPKMSALLVE